MNNQNEAQSGEIEGRLMQIRDGSTLWAANHKGNLLIKFDTDGKVTQFSLSPAGANALLLMMLEMRGVLA